MLTRRRFLGYAALAPAALHPSLWAQVASQSTTDLPAPVISAKALAIHKRALVFDGHVHALDREFYHGGSMGTRSPVGQWDLVRAREGGVGAFFLSVFIPEEYYPSRFETKQAFRRVDHALRQLEMNRDQVELALNADDIERIRAKGKLAAVLDIEGSYDLDGDLGVLRDLYQLGVRSAQLSAHNWDQNYADACCSPPKWNGLNEHGRDLIREMNRLGMVINVSHSSDQTISQAIELSDVPIVSTHHGLRAINDIPRNMPDNLLKKLAAKGGVMGFQIGSEFAYPREYAWLTEHRHKTFWDTTSIPDRVKGKTIYEVDELVAPQFPMLGAQVPESVQMAVDDWVAVVDRAIQLVGEDHISIGSDFDGGPTLAKGMRDVRDLPMITDAMLRRGYSEERIDKFWGGNLLRVFKQITQTRG
ncbi:dipeptidase [Granulicella sibirica]|uniref:Zn-dependent dipeptidase n=1 Tax=Granulicella sibirica TaxID=2479048 RepID=A0A4Q0SWQ4_9BACT|nr:dipeptidase [Granulicella sibirica]RXH55513.1 Zn-dependent dipeptidase [Granulicella sibirica]